MEKEIVLLKKLNEDAVIPSYAHDGDLGMDVTAISVEYNDEYDYYAYHTGLALANEKYKGFLLFPRSSNRKQDCYLTNSVGVADTYLYRGEIVLTFKNRTSFDVHKVIDKFNYLEKNGTLNGYECKLTPMDFLPYSVGDRVAQLILAEFPSVEFKVVDELNDTVRGDGGHGSTGR